MKKIHLFTLILLMASPQLFAAVIGAPVVASDPPDPTLFAAAPSSINTSTNDNRVYAGLKWSLSGGIKPEAVLGFRHANINSSGDTDGGDISISAKFMDGFQPGQIRAKYFNGKEDVQGEVGGGYDFTQGIFGSLGVHAPYSNIGLDLLPNAQTKFNPYVQVDSIKGNNKPNPSCPIGYSPREGTCRPEPSDRRLKRSIRLLARLHNGLKIYAFKYLWSDVVYVGVMAQDLLQNPTWKDAVIKKANGFYTVNYAMLGLKMTTFAQWKKDGLASITSQENITLN
jgi:hypothetical protein